MEGKDPNDKHQFSIIYANYDFVETMKMELTAGRAFFQLLWNRHLCLYHQ